MKTNRQLTSGIFRCFRPGFALVITLSLMILLTVIAVGLLTLSSVALRSSAQGNAMATARANARLALMLAIGDLQKSAGPDQRVTARADVVTGTEANPMLTGVWKSWEIKATSPPSASEFEQSARDAKFQGWLVSGTDPAKTRQVAYAKQAPASPVTLWGRGTLGDKANANSFVSAAKIPLGAASGTASGTKTGTQSKAGNPTGAFAWAVCDEGVKVRINTHYTDEAASTGMKTAELGTGERPGVEFISGLNALERKFFEKDASESATIAKGITRLNFALAGDYLGKGVREALQPLTHDVTTQSIGLFTDTAHGGLKQDFQTLMNASTLPSDYQGKGVYASRLKLPVSATSNPSDPTWSSLQQFARLHRGTVTNSGGAPLIKSQTPSAAATVSGTTTTINRTPPAGVVLLPAIAKVQMLVSLVGRDIYGGLPVAPIERQLTAAEKANGIHGPQEGQFRSTRFDYDLHVMYAPIVTLHNPYNVALEFTSVRVEFVHVPFSMQIFRNGVAQSTGLVPLETMYADNESGNLNKTFGMNLKTKTASGAPGSATFVLMPGEVKMFSSYIDPNRTYAQDLGDRKFWDIYVGSGITTNIEAMPGWRGDGIGFDCDWVTGAMRVNGNADEGHWEACLGLAWDDQIHCLFAPISTTQSANKFVINMSATVGSSAMIVSAIELDYESINGLQTFTLGSNGTMRYPKENAVPNTIKGMNLVDRATTPINALQRVKPFALLSAQAKSTSGGRDTTMVDGRLATKPWCFAHANIGASSQKVISEHSSNFSHEIDLQLLESGTTNLLQVDLQDRSNFISGHTGTYGTKFGLQYEIPLAPIQTLASLNGANPGGSSGYLPRFAQPIGNSWAHPLISAGKISESNANSGYTYLDHSFLLNLALYDGFYFSGLGDQSGPFCTPSKTSASLAADFAAGKELDDPRLMLHPPDGKSANEFTTEAANPTAYVNLAGWQMMQGAFNINSTSAAAWKTMLASIHDKDAVFNLLDKTNSTSKITALKAPVAGKKSRISRFRFPASKSFDDGGEAKDGYWMGAREYSDADLGALADNIVKQVRKRGPFLSMAEFVNRRLGTGDTSLRGALQQAIDDSGVNRKSATDADAGFDITMDQVKTYKYANAAAGAGSSYQGAPGYLTQADLLNVLGNAATPRSDTFTIRGYGDARDAQGNILARATCEATVQRFPEWLDPLDKVEAVIDKLQSRSNKIFGRRFLITSLRWLNPKEI